MLGIAVCKAATARRAQRVRGLRRIIAEPHPPVQSIDTAGVDIERRRS